MLKRLLVAALVWLAFAIAPAHAQFPNDWYWVVTDTNPSTQVYSSKRGAFVSNSGDADYLTWVGAGFTAPTIDTANNLYAFINNVNIGLPRNNYGSYSGAGNLTLSTTTSGGSNPIATFMLLAPGSGNSVTMPPAGAVGMVPIGQQIWIGVNNGSTLVLKKNDGTNILTTLSGNNNIQCVLYDNSSAAGGWLCQPMLRNGDQIANSSLWNGTTIGVAFGGTGTGTAFTQGSVVFAGASGTYAQDNAKLYWDDTNDRLCVSCTAGTHSLEVAPGAATADGVYVKRYSTGGTNASYWGIQIQNAGATDGFIIGMASSAFATGGFASWIPNSAGFLYYPSTMYLGTGTGSTYAVKLGSSNDVTLGAVTLNSTINKLTLTAPASAATLTLIDGTTITGPATTSTLAAINLEGQTLSGGANVTAKSQSTGSLTINCSERPLQYITNGGAFTLTAPANDGSCVLLVTNNGSAGAITFSGFSVGASTGDPLTTTDTYKYSIHVWRVNSVAGYRIAAHQ
jgi:hypothetical protein